MFFSTSECHSDSQKKLLCWSFKPQEANVILLFIFGARKKVLQMLQIVSLVQILDLKKKSFIRILKD